ncbi:MAG: hypothetical protein V1837_03250 [Candidatus Woesearchaeota archaeon]
MPRHHSDKERYNFLIDRSVYDDFSMLCEDLGLVRSKKLENYMKQFIEENKQLLKKLKEK